MGKKITMDFSQSCLKVSSLHDTFGFVMDRLTKSAHFLPIREDYKTEKLAKIYTNEIVARHGVPVSIISDCDGRFIHVTLGKLFRSVGTETRHEVQAIPPLSRRQSERHYSNAGGMLRALCYDLVAVGMLIFH
ncbi:putative reverse transcriptase domain-containing protein [Tanacetum coccineum]